MVLEQLRATKYCMNSFHISYYKTNKNGEKYEEPIFIELKIFHDIIGAHYNYIIMQDVRNKVVFGIERASGSFQDPDVDGRGAVYMNHPFCIEFLEERMRTPGDNILQYNIFIILSSL